MYWSRYKEIGYVRDWYVRMQGMAGTLHEILLLPFDAHHSHYVFGRRCGMVTSFDQRIFEAVFVVVLDYVAVPFDAHHSH